MSIYIVKPNDTVDTIAKQLQIPTDLLIYNNQLIPPYQLATGQTLFIPSVSSALLPSSFEINGYAYTYISSWVLAQTLPYLTRLSIFSYGFTTGGHLILPPENEQWMISAAKNENVKPYLTLTPLDENGQFNNDLISSVIWNESAKSTLINECLSTMESKGYFGIDIDFEYIKKEDRDQFTVFVSDLTTQMHQHHFKVSIALAPKTSSDQKGLLYEGKDYHALGAIVDSVLLMTYEWGYKYGPNMAIAPIHMVEKVVDYALTQISSEKIHLGIPNYGYDWPLPFIQNQTEATTIGNVEAVMIAIKNHAIIHFDTQSQSPYFNYVENGISHEVWFEDLQSIQSKIQLIHDKKLSGCGYWQIMRWWRANWLLLENNL